MRTASMSSLASTSSSTFNQNLNYVLKPMEREQFELHRNKEGILEKKSTAFLVGWQKRFFKLKCNKNFLLSYFKEDKKNGEPQGVLNLSKIKNITKVSDTKFTFNYDDERLFELKAKNKADRDGWVESIEFLIEIREKLGNMVDERSVSVSTYFSVDTPIVEAPEESSAKSKGSKSYKYANLGKDEVMGIMDENENNQLHTIDKQLNNQKKQSEQILIETGIWDYISLIPEAKRNCRIQYGFLGKPSRNALKFEQSRWLFLISSRPLAQDAYLQDADEIHEDDLPILIKFDTIYYYSVGFNNKDAELKGEIKTIDIDSVHINAESKGTHSFTIDAKSK